MHPCQITYSTEIFQSSQMTNFTTIPFLALILSSLPSFVLFSLFLLPWTFYLLPLEVNSIGRVAVYLCDLMANISRLHIRHLYKIGTSQWSLPRVSSSFG